MKTALTTTVILLLFIASSLPAQVITKPTQMGINISDPAPGVSLHIKDGFEAIRLDGNSPFISFYNGTDYRGYLYMSGSNMYLFNRKSGTLNFATSDNIRMLINSLGDVGLGTVFPQTRLHVTQGTLSGGLFNSNTIAGFEKGTGNAYLSILTDASYESAILFGNQNSPQHGGIFYNDPATPNGLQFRNNDNLIRMSIDNQGDVGIGVTTPDRPLHVKARSTTNQWGIILESTNGSTFWEVSTFNGFYNFFYNKNATPVSRIETDGTYNSSDRRLKQNIRPYKEVLPLLKKLQVSTYRMKNSSKKNKTSLGLIAQDVAEVFPEIVSLDPNRNGELYYSMDYSKIGVIAVKAIQEIQKELEEKESVAEKLEAKVADLEAANERLYAENDELKERLAAVENLIAQLQDNCCTSSKKVPLHLPAAGINERVRLDQNQPNPFSAGTLIRYFIPTEVRSAGLQVMTAEGKVIHQLTIEERGEGELVLETQSLPPGVYFYALLIDGKMFESKRMVLNR